MEPPATLCGTAIPTTVVANDRLQLMEPYWKHTSGPRNMGLSQDVNLPIANILVY